LRLMPRLSLSLGEVIGLQGRVLRVEPSKAELGGQLSAALQDDWGVPNDLGLQTAWQPPENWLDDVHQVNRVCLNLIRSIWGRPTIVAVSSVVPLEFQSNRGPVVVRADTRSIRRIQQAIREWWQSQSSSNLPDIYLVVHSPLGWMPKCEPGYEPGSLTVLVAPSGGDWAVQVPPMAGMPVYVRSFVELLRPETLYKRREEMREWLERHFDLWDSVTVFKAKRSMEEELGKVFSESEVLEVFKMLAEDGLYVLATLNDKPALRRATAGERTRTLLSRRLVEIGAFFIGVLGSSIIWMFHSKLEPRLSGHWIVWLIITLVCVTLCEVLGRFAVKFRKRRR